MKRLITLFSLCFFLISFSFAQDAPAKKNGKAVFETTEHEFGEIEEDGGPVTTTFAFKNEGTDPITLTYVKASCGCTTPKWTKEPIAPGESGEVTATYNPFNRPGKFTKTITVKTDGDPAVQTLWIRGSVNARVKGVKDFYPYEDGNVRFSRNHLSLGKMKNTETDTASIVIYNQGDKVINIFPAKSKLPEYLSIDGEAFSVEPEKTVKIPFNYDATKVGQFDFVFKRFELATDDGEATMKKVNVSAQISEDFTKLTDDEVAAGPRITLPEDKFDFGKVKSGDTPTKDITVTNTGKSDLHIRKVKATTGGIVATPAKNTIAPGESTTINLRLFSQGRTGVKDRIVQIITNDPTQPEITFTVKSNIIEE